MLFNSLDFAWFFPVAFTLYWMLNGTLRAQNLFIVIASFVFYGWWSIWFLGLMVISASTDFIVGILLAKHESRRQQKIILLCSIAINLGILCFFKYFNFFVDNFIRAFSILGHQFNRPVLTIVLPVGISFYTFQAMSYTIDVYRKKLKPTKDIVAYFAFISFFPQLVAGPIERATHMLPQFHAKRRFNYDEAVNGLRQILWGLFKKIVIADNCSLYVNDIFSNYAGLPGSTLLAGAVLFSIQIYGDFSGYSDIAIGCARLLGFSIMRNFAYPYFSRDIAEFWRRWHISLTTWFKDYVYIPLGGSRGSKLLRIRNVFIIFILSGLWHGANWTYILWGCWNAVCFLPFLFLKRNKLNTHIIAKGRILPSIKEAGQIFITFILVTFGWILFRSASIQDAEVYIRQIILSVSGSPLQQLISFFRELVTKPVFSFILLMFLMEWIQRERQHALDFDNQPLPMIARKAVYSLLTFLIVWYSGTPQQFIYFQF